MMNDWRETDLGELIHVKHGFAFKGESFMDSGDELVLTPGNFRPGGGLSIRPGKEKYYGGAYPPQFRLAPGDLLVVMTDLKQDAPILGSPATIPDVGTFLHNQRLGLVTVRTPSELDSRFLYWFLASDYSRAQLRATATGSTVRHTAPERIAQVKLSLPPIDIQRRIAEILDALDGLLENDLRRVSLLEEMAQAIHREWFVRFRYPDHQNDKLVESVSGAIPEGWQLVPLGQLCDQVTLTVLPEEVPADTPSVGLEHIPRKSLTLRDWGSPRGLASRKIAFTKGDVLFGKIRPYFHKVSIAPLDGICSTDAIVLRPKRLALVSLTAFSDDFVGYAVRTSNGTKMPRADWKVLREWTVPVPPDSLLMRFERDAGAMIAECQMLVASARTVTGIRDMLLPRLIAGRIDVSDIDLDALEVTR